MDFRVGLISVMGVIAPAQVGPEWPYRKKGSEPSRQPRGGLLTVMELLGHSSNTATKRDAGASRRNKRRSAVFARYGIEKVSFPSGKEHYRVADGKI